MIPSDQRHPESFDGISVLAMGPHSQDKRAYNGSNQQGISVQFNLELLSISNLRSGLTYPKTA